MTDGPNATASAECGRQQPDAVPARRDGLADIWNAEDCEHARCAVAGCKLACGAKSRRSPTISTSRVGVRKIDDVGNFLDHEIAAILRGIGVDTGDSLGRNTDRRTY